MPSNKADQLLKYLSFIGYANPLNMVLVTHRKADTTKGALTEVYRLYGARGISHRRPLRT